LRLKAVLLEEQQSCLSALACCLAIKQTPTDRAHATSWAIKYLRVQHSSCRAVMTDVIAKRDKVVHFGPLPKMLMRSNTVLGWYYGFKLEIRVNIIKLEQLGTEKLCSMRGANFGAITNNEMPPFGRHEKATSLQKCSRWGLFWYCNKVLKPHSGMAIEVI